MFGLSKFRLGVYIAFGLAILAGFVALILDRGGGGNQGTQAVSLTVWGTYTPAEWEGLNGRNDDVRVTGTYRQHAEATIYDEYLEAVANGKSPDLIVIPYSLQHKFDGKYAKIPFTSYPQRDFVNQYADGAHILIEGEAIAALPLAVDPVVMYYNRTHFSEANILTPPKNWSEIYTLTDLLNRKSGLTIDRSAVALGGGTNIEHIKEVMSMLMLQSNDTLAYLDSLDGKKQYVFASPLTYADSFRYYMSFANPFQKVYSWNQEKRNSIDAFAAGEASIYFGLGSDYPRIREKNPNLNFDVAVVPQGNETKPITYGELYVVMIPTTSKNIQAAYTSAFALSSQSAVAKRGTSFPYIPVHRAVLATKQEGLIKPVLYRSAVIFRTWRDSDPINTNKAMADSVLEALSGKFDQGTVLSRLKQKIDLKY